MAQPTDSDGTQQPNALTQQLDSPAASRAPPDNGAARTPPLRLPPSRTLPFKAAWRGSRATQRGPGFTEAETTSMLAVIEEVMPIGRDEWERVLALHNNRWSQTGRTVEAMWRKFSRLHQQKGPTGNPYIAPNVRKEKELKEKIIEVSQTVAGELPDHAIGFSAHDELAEDTRFGPNSVASNDLVLIEETENSTVRTNAAEVVGTGDASPSSPSPIFFKRATHRAGKATAGLDLSNLVQLQLAQDKQRIEEEREYRKMQREMWEQDRIDRVAAEQARREREEAERQDRREREEAECAERFDREDRQYRQFMQMIGLMVARKE